MKVRRDFNKIIGVGLVTQELIWITGATRTGKTTRLMEQFAHWMRSRPVAPTQNPNQLPGVLVVAAIGDNRLDLVDRLTTATEGKYPVTATTPLGFVQDEVTLFYPLLVQELHLKAQFPIRLHPETEQELATQLWRAELDAVISAQPAISEPRLVRRVLDLLQLAALGGIAIADIPVLLQQGFGDPDPQLPLPFEQLADWLQRWQDWCLEQGFLSYGITASLYWQHLLPHPTYQQHLGQRFQFLLADDVDEYPAIARDLFAVLLQQGVAAAFTFNPEGSVRLGLGADPTYLATLADQCQRVELSDRPVPALATDYGTAIVELVMNPLAFTPPTDSLQTLQTASRAELLRQMAEVIVTAVQTQQLQPREIAVIGPGLDAIARYALMEILTKQGIPVTSLHEQRPLNTFPVIRALLTLLALIYPGLGRLVDRDAIAEMLVVLSQEAGVRSQELGVRSQESGVRSQKSGVGSTSAFAPPLQPPTPNPVRLSALRLELRSKAHVEAQPLHPLIDPVRAGLLADYCFAPHPDLPRLLPATTFPRWDRLGYQAADAYQRIGQWITKQQEQLEQRLIPNPVAVCDRAIQHFFLQETALPYNQLAAIRQLLEVAQHYWEVQQRVGQRQRGETPPGMVVSRLIQLLRSGTITANPYPVRPMGAEANAVTLATVFQYRSQRGAHRWQFWLDAASPRWLTGVDALFAAPLFGHQWSGQLWTGADALAANEQRLRRILLDLLARATERVYLCHSELATSGQEQTGVLLPLVNGSTLLELPV